MVVIGAGAAGVFSAYLLQKNAPNQFDIRILEKNDRIGGNTRSELEVWEGQAVNIDGGAQFFSETSQPDYCKMLRDEGFFAQQGVIAQTDAGMSVWSVTKNRTSFFVPPQLPEILKKVEDDPITWLNFGILTLAAIEEYLLGCWDKTFGEWINGISFQFTAAEKADFIAKIARPLMYQFGLVNPENLDSLSAKFVVFLYVGSLPWHGGSLFSVYNSMIGLDGILKKLLEKYGLTAQCNAPVTSVALKATGGYVVTVEGGTTYDADEVIFATSPQWTLGMLAANQPGLNPLKLVLSGMKYLTVPVQIQRTQSSYMPGDKTDWSVSNVLVVDDPTGAPTNYILSVWFGPLREQKIGADFFKSWGSPQLVPPNQPIIHEQTHELMIGTPAFIALRQQLRTQYQGVNNLWFAGGYILDYDTQNASLKSATLVANGLLRKHTPDTLEIDTPSRVQPGAPDEEFLGQPQWEGVPWIISEILRKVEEVAADHPGVKAWQETRQNH